MNEPNSDWMRKPEKPNFPFQIYCYEDMLCVCFFFSSLVEYVTCFEMDFALLFRRNSVCPAYNGLCLVIMNSNHAFDIKARPME